MILAKNLPLLSIKLKDNFQLPKVLLKYNIIRYNIYDILDSSFIEELNNCNLALREVQLFISAPNLTSNIHIDGHSTDLDAAAINLVINDNNNWKMQWFNTHLHEQNKQISPGNTNYLSFKPEDCKLIHEFTSTCAFLVQVGVAHRIVNNSDKMRYCLSLRFIENSFGIVLKNASRYCSKI